MPASPFRSTALALLTCAFVGAAVPSFAFSQITDENNEPLPSREGIVSVPLPPVEPPAAPEAEAEAETEAAPEPSVPDVAPAGPEAPGAPSAEAPPVAVRYGEEALPAPVRDLRRRLIEIARSGDISQLAPFLEQGGDSTTVSLIETDQSPVDVLREASGDGEGVEMLAILLETLEAGHVHLEPGGENEIYVWPYFTQVNLTQLTRTQLVELFELVTAGDYQRMVENGSYDFYRVGISPEGRFEFFVAGD